MAIKSSTTLVTEALDQIKTISIDEAFEKSSKNECNLIDIRDIRELDKEGRVENSSHIPRGIIPGYNSIPVIIFLILDL